MSTAKVSEISATSANSFHNAIGQGISRANKNLRNIRSACVTEFRINVKDGSIREYQVDMMVTFVVDN